MRTYNPQQITDTIFPHASSAQIALLLGLDTRTVERWRKGIIRLDRWTADKLACHNLGTHPANIWPDWYNDDDD